MQTTHYKIPTGSETLACTVNYANTATPPTILCLHGGGPVGKESVQYLAEALQQQGLSVVRFDFSGQGESTGSMGVSSLKKRLLETYTVMDYFGMGDGISVIGTSMGGYIACALAKEVLLENLVLFGPAAYSVQAWDVPFNDGFTEIIRTENSYLQSDIQELLLHFQGKALFIIGEHDEIIPSQVVELYMQALSHCEVFEKYIVPGCPHPVHRWAAEHAQVREKIERMVAGFLG
jgi:pimeloyl-ACP methyl ester carboxylesterase